MFVPRAVVRKPAPKITHSNAQLLKRQSRSEQQEVDCGPTSCEIPRTPGLRTLDDGGGQPNQCVQHQQQAEESRTNQLSSVYIAPNEGTEPNPGPPCSSAQAPSAAGASLSSNPSGDDNDDEPVLSYSKQQRWPAPGEPACVICGRYGAYIVDQTDQDVCSLECKARHVMLVAKERPWHYKEHGEVTQMSDDLVTALRKEVKFLNLIYLGKQCGVFIFIF